MAQNWFLLSFYCSVVVASFLRLNIKHHRAQRFHLHVERGLRMDRMHVEDDLYCIFLFNLERSACALQHVTGTLKERKTWRTSSEYNWSVQLNIHDRMCRLHTDKHVNTSMYRSVNRTVSVSILVYTFIWTTSEGLNMSCRINKRPPHSENHLEPWFFYLSARLCWSLHIAQKTIKS